MEHQVNNETVNFLEQVEAYFHAQQSLYGNEIYLDNNLRKQPSSSNKDKRSRLIDLFNETKKCQQCELAKKRNKFVFGSGSPEAQIMLISEAPGFNEDQQGKPFVGEAGKLLDKILAAIQLSRKDIFITNVLKCHPPGNRDPQPDEISACEPILKRQIEIIKPRFILILGRIAAHFLLNTTQPLGQLRGKIFEIFNAKAVVTYHPAALLRNQNLKRGAWEDVQLFQKMYK